MIDYHANSTDTPVAERVVEDVMLFMWRELVTKGKKIHPELYGKVHGLTADDGPLDDEAVKARKEARRVRGNRDRAVRRERERLRKMQEELGNVSPEEGEVLDLPGRFTRGGRRLAAWEVG